MSPAIRQADIIPDFERPRYTWLCLLNVIPQSERWYVHYSCTGCSFFAYSSSMCLRSAVPRSKFLRINSATRTSWVSQKSEVLIGWVVDRRCPAQYYIPGINLLGCDLFTPCWCCCWSSCVPTNQTEDSSFFHSFEGYDWYSDPKQKKRP